MLSLLLMGGGATNGSGKPHRMAAEEEQNCRPYDFKETGFASLCEYVRNNSDLCEGGGYLLWTEMEVCMASGWLQALTVLGALLFFLFLFLHLSTTADSFFCKNIASIVDLHKISQNIAGITFMAFGNGAPDIFGSIASVTSIARPRADLAISELLGGGIFVTTCVIAAISYRPFLLMRRPILRDICFYLAALLLLVLVAHWDGQMHVWQPLAFLLLYVLYALTVVLGNLYCQQMSNSNSSIGTRRARMHRAIAKFMPKKVAPVGKAISSVSANNGIKELSLTPSDIIQVPKKGEEEQKQQQHQQQQLDDGGNNADRHKKKPMVRPEKLALPGTLLVIPITEHFQHHHHNMDGQQKQQQGEAEGEEDFHALDYFEAGKFFAKEELDAENVAAGNGDGEEEEEDVTTKAASTISSTSITSPLSSISISQSISSSTTQSGQERATTLWRRELHRFWCQLRPLELRKFRHARWHQRAYRIAKVPSMLLLKLTVPCAYQPWSKPMAMLHAFTAPLVLCAAFKWLTIPIMGDDSPLVFGELALLFSVLFTAFVWHFTSVREEPPCYRWIASYLGFVLSIAWIYATAAEVLNVVLMFGNLFHIPYQILGLTAIAWCNSIGDMIADISVARQRMPRMAFSAAIGAPLFNLMVGFGCTFLIAKMQGKTVMISADPVSNVMFVFLGLALSATLILLLVQKFYVRRIHGLILIVLYLLFLICVILTQLGIFRRISI